MPKNLQHSDQSHKVRVRRIDSNPHLCTSRALAGMISKESGSSNCTLMTCRNRMFTDCVLFGVLHRFQHCTGHIMTGSWKGRGNQYIQFVRVLYCKLPTNGKQLPAFPLEAVPGIEPRPQRWEARVLPLCHHGPLFTDCDVRDRISDIIKLMGLGNKGWTIHAFRCSGVTLAFGSEVPVEQI